jgi:hypothetical protein
MKPSRKRKPLTTRICRNPACKQLFQPTTQRQIYHTDKCRFAGWMSLRTRRVVTRLQMDEQDEPSLWYAVAVKADDHPRALFREMSDAIRFGKDYLKAKHLIYSVELHLPPPRQNPVASITEPPASANKINTSKLIRQSAERILRTAP